MQRVKLASGIELDDVLPCRRISFQTRACGSLRRPRIASIMRPLAWCGTIRSRSAIVMSDRAQASVSMLPIRRTASPKIFLPSMCR